MKEDKKIQLNYLKYQISTTSKITKLMYQESLQLLQAEGLGIIIKTFQKKLPRSIFIRFLKNPYLVKILNLKY